VTSLRGLIESAREELPAPSLARWAAVFFTFSVLTFLISLAASQAFLALAGIAYGAHIVRGRRVPDSPPVKLPLALFCLFSTLSIFWAENRAVGWFTVRKLVLFLILLLAVNLVTSSRHLRLLYQSLFLESAAVGIIAAVQFAIQYRAERALHPGQVYIYMRGDRVRGLMGHWMNFGGQQMLVFVSLAAFLLLASHAAGAATDDEAQEDTALKRGATTPGARRLWWLVASVVAVSIVLNFTRGVWVGCFIAGIYLLARWKPRCLWILPLLLIVGYLAAPDLIRKRFDSVRHPSADPSLAIRLEMWRVGWRMMRQHPLVGVGPGNVPETYALYVPPGTVPVVGYHDHLHNDTIQLGAERGLPCLAAWVWLMIALGWHFVRIRRQLIGAPGKRHLAWMADAALACWLAFLAEGCFEFNFGTSPVLMVFLFMMSTPFVAEMKVRNQKSEVRSQNKDQNLVNGSMAR
jgi:hypothetical protein